MTYEDALLNFQARYGAEWSMFIQSELWKAARELMQEYGPARELRKLTPLELINEGAVRASVIQGWQMVIGHMEETMTARAGEAPVDFTLSPTYEPEPDEPQAPQPTPAPTRKTRRAK